MAKFYTYSQNNSGGGFDHDPGAGIGYEVIVEAESSEDANDRAEMIGLYFNGCAYERDCPCCGDRWYEASDWDVSDTVPETRGGWGLPSYIHYLDGTVEEVPFSKDKYNG